MNTWVHAIWHTASRAVCAGAAALLLLSCQLPFLTSGNRSGVNSSPSGDSRQQDTPPNASFLLGDYQSFVEKPAAYFSEILQRSAAESYQTNSEVAHLSFAVTEWKVLLSGMVEALRAELSQLPEPGAMRSDSTESAAFPLTNDDRFAPRGASAATVSEALASVEMRRGALVQAIEQLQLAAESPTLTYLAFWPLAAEYVQAMSVLSESVSGGSNSVMSAVGQFFQASLFRPEQGPSGHLFGFLVPGFSPPFEQATGQTRAIGRAAAVFPVYFPREARAWYVDGRLVDLAGLVARQIDEATQLVSAADTREFGRQAHNILFGNQKAGSELEGLVQKRLTVVHRLWELAAQTLPGRVGPSAVALEMAERVTRDPSVDLTTDGVRKATAGITPSDRVDSLLEQVMVDELSQKRNMGPMDWNALRETTSVLAWDVRGTLTAEEREGLTRGFLDRSDQAFDEASQFRARVQSALSPEKP